MRLRYYPESNMLHIELVENTSTDAAESVEWAVTSVEPDGSTSP